MRQRRILVATPTPDVGTTGPQFGGDLRIVSQGSISTLDPVFSLFYVVNAVASQIYEGLYGWDGNLEGTASGWVSRSRPMLTDGVHVHAAVGGRIPQRRDLHVGGRDSVDQQVERRGHAAAGIVRRFTDDDALQAVDDTTFTWKFDEPLGAVIFILGIPHGLMPMIPESLAATPFTEPTARTWAPVHTGSLSGFRETR